MTVSRVIMLTALAASWAAAPNARADESAGCTARFSPPAVVGLSLVEPLSGMATAEAFELRLRDLSSPSCRFVVRFEEGSQAGGLRGDVGGRQLDFRIAHEAASSNALFDSQTPSTAADSRSTSTGEFRLYLIAAPGSAPRAGIYTGDVVAVLRAADGGPEIDRVALALQAVVPAEVQAFISGAVQAGDGGYAMLDLDELAVGKTGSATLRVRSTADIDISFESDNNGRLKHETDADGFVSYDLYADGRLADLVSAQPDTLPAAPASRDVALDVQITDTSRAPAGAYRDRITITVSAH